MRLTRLLEDLDDKDTFGLDCTYIGCDRRPDHDEFHAAHEAARYAAMDATVVYPYQAYYGLDRGYKKKYKGNQQYWDNFVAAMAKQGYRLNAGEFIKEDLDDKDEFDVNPEIDIDEYIVEYWGMSACSFVMLSGAKEYGWVPKSSGRWEQFEGIKTQFPDLYEAAVEVARQSIE